MKNSTRKKLNKRFKVINTPEEGPAANEENAAEFIKPKKQRQNKKKVVIKNVERGPVTNEGNAAEPIKPEKKSRKKFFKRKKKMNNPNNITEDIDNLNEELMGKWKKGLKNIKHSSLGGSMSYYEDRIYHSGYLDGYYASMELYHSDDSEMTDEEKAKARRKRRRRNIALGVAGAAGVAAGGYAIGRALRKRGKVKPRPAKQSGPRLERVYPAGLDIETPIGWDHKNNKPKYRWDDLSAMRYNIHKKNLKSHFWDHDKKEEVYVPDLDPDFQNWKKKYNL